MLHLMREKYTRWIFKKNIDPFNPPWWLWLFNYWLFSPSVWYICKANNFTAAFVEGLCRAFEDALNTMKNGIDEFNAHAQPIKVVISSERPTDESGDDRG